MPPLESSSSLSRSVQSDSSSVADSDQLANDVNVDYARHPLLDDSTARGSKPVHGAADEDKRYTDEPDYAAPKHRFEFVEPSSQQERRCSRLSRAWTIRSAITAAVLIVAVSIVSVLNREALISHARKIQSTWLSPSSPPDTFVLPDDRVAFASFVAEKTGDENSEIIDHYFENVRLLIYQSLHRPETRSEGIPFIVLVNPELGEDVQTRLRKDGAIVYQKPHVNASWLWREGSYKNVMDKLQLFSLYNDWDRICFLDADTILRAPLGGIFNDPSARPRKTLKIPQQTKDDEAPLPEEYLFAARHDASGHATRRKPRRWLPGWLQPRTQEGKDMNYLNAGFLVFKPNKILYEYYLSLLEPRKFPPYFPEQALFNYAHRRFGNMPWMSLQWGWNVQQPAKEDLNTTIRSFHAHLWDFGWPVGEEFYRDLWYEDWRQMRAFWKQKEGQEDGERYAKFDEKWDKEKAEKEAQKAEEEKQKANEDEEKDNADEEKTEGETEPQAEEPAEDVAEEEAKGKAEEKLETGSEAEQNPDEEPGGKKGGRRRRSGSNKWSGWRR